jgi:nitrogen regulatory protein PII
MFKLITCIASEDRAKKATQGLADEYDIQAMVSYFARGFGRSAPTNTGQLGQQTEKVIINVVIESNRVDEIFSYIFHAADLDRPHGGIIYVTAVNQAVSSPQILASNVEEALE